MRLRHQVPHALTGQTVTVTRHHGVDSMHSCTTGLVICHHPDIWQILPFRWYLPDINMHAVPVPLSDVAKSMLTLHIYQRTIFMLSCRKMTMMTAHCRLNSGPGDTLNHEHFRAYTASGILVILHSLSRHVVADVKWQRILQRLPVIPWQFDCMSHHQYAGPAELMKDSSTLPYLPGTIGTVQIYSS